LCRIDYASQIQFFGADEEQGSRVAGGKEDVGKR
jgi:hypothetical protein